MARISRTHAAGPASLKAPGAGARKKAAPRAAATGKTAAAARAAGITSEERYLLIAETAYYRAERRGFVPGHEIEDWLDAETEVGRMIAGSRNDRAAEKA